jgi:hypothetical protein
LEGLAVSGGIILRWFLKKYVGVDWIHLAQDKAQQRALVKTVINFLVPQNAGNFFG